MQTLHAGPWVGEFGWELFGWQGVVRTYSKWFDLVSVYGPESSRYLYSDFADEYHAVELIDGDANMWMRTESVDFKLPSHNPGDAWLLPQQLTLIPNAPGQTFIKYGKKIDGFGYDILIHARSLTKYGSDVGNYPEELWPKIIEAFPDKKIACIGTTSGAYLVPDTKDMRSLPLEALCTLMASSTVVIGPSSGPMHLAMLCDVPVVVWSGYARSGLRYKRLWNPFNVQAEIIMPFGDPWSKKEPWHPKPETIIESVKRVLNG